RKGIYRSPGRSSQSCQSRRRNRSRFYHLFERSRQPEVVTGYVMNLAETKTPLSILVIDDEAQIQRLLTVALQANGYRVSTAIDGQHGIATAAQQRHDAIILDLGLPDMNGLQVLKNVREWTQTPVIVLTVQDGEFEKVESLD